MLSFNRAVLFLGLLAAGLLNGHAQAATPASPLAVIQRLPLGGTGGWDYLSFDAQRHHLFVSRGDRVQVVDTQQLRAVGSIDNTSGVHGIAIAQDLREGFTSNGLAASVTVFDLDSLKTLATIGGTGQKPDAIAYEPQSKRVWTFNGKSHDASVIDPVARRVIDTVALPGKPEFAVADKDGHLFVNIEDKSELVKIDGKTHKVLQTWSLAPCQSPSGLAIDAAHHRLFSVCDNKTMAITDSQSGHLVATVAIGDGPDAVVFDADAAMIYSSNGESGTLTAVHENDSDHFVVAGTVATQPTARTLALDPQQHRLYLSAATPDKNTPAGQRPSMEPGSFTVLVVGSP
jgi:DNA-binding beta-propeller fold protein YncE